MSIPDYRYKMNHYHYAEDQVFTGEDHLPSKEDIVRLLDELLAASLFPANWATADVVSMPAIVPGSHEDQSDDVLLVTWDEGPYEWANRFSEWWSKNGVSGIGVEAVYTYCISVYKEL